MSKKYNVPSQILGDQAQRIADLYRSDIEGHRAALTGIGVTGDVIEDVETLGQAVLDFEVQQEVLKAEYAFKRAGSTGATRAIIDWRDKQVMPRVKLAFAKSPSLSFFRPGKLRSQRTASVLREARLLVLAIRKFAGEPEPTRRGVDEDLAAAGEELIRRAEINDAEAAQALAAQRAATRRLYKAEERLSSLLGEIERATVTVFPADSTAHDRYRLNRIRNYVAVQHGKSASSAKTQTNTFSNSAPLIEPAPNAQEPVITA